MKIKLLYVFILLSNSINAQKARNITSTSVLLFDDSKKIKIYNSYKKDSFTYISNDTAKDDYFTISVFKKERSVYKISATSILYPEVRGYITNENLGIYTRPRNATIALYEKPSYKSKKTSIRQEDGIMVRVIEIEIPWLKVSFNINKQNYIGWLPYIYQCPNPYSTCN